MHILVSAKTILNGTIAMPPLHGDGDHEGRWENGRMNGFGKYVFADDNTWSVKTYEDFTKMTICMVLGN